MSTLYCPRCRNPLTARPVQGGAGHACGGCGGIWLDSGASQEVNRALCEHAVALAESASATAPWRIDVTARLGCPACGKLLERYPVPVARIELDHCREHGTWFDRDELGHVCRAMAVKRAYGPAAGATAGAVAGAAGIAVAGAAVGAGAYAAAAQRPRTELAGEDIADAAEVAVDGAEVALDVGEVAGGAFEIIGGLFEGW